MIRYALRCDRDHSFDSWFGSSADYDRLSAAGLVACAVCGTTGVVKELMTPAIGQAAAGGPAPDRPLSAPASPAEQALAALRRHVEATAENVGRDFPHEARRIHEGAAPERPIYGEARPADARRLIDEGIEIMPLPWPSDRGDH